MESCGFPSFVNHQLPTANRQRAFTLIEVLVAALVITLGASASFALAQRTLSFTADAAFRFEASYLAQEGMEIARNIRDANFLKIHKGQGGAWTDGLTESGCSGGCQADYTQNSLGAYQDTFLKFSNGRYSYEEAGTDSLYKRKITVTQQGGDVLEVEVEVTWQERGRSHSVKAAGELYNWLSP